MWKHVQSGALGSEVLGGWQNRERENFDERAKEIELRMCIDPQADQDADDRLAAKIAKELEKQ